MSEWLNRVHFGDCLETLRRMPDGIVNTCVTSPPYFGLRDYGVPSTEWPAMTYRTLGGEVSVPAMVCCLGLEPTPGAFIGHKLMIFREVRRALRDDGTCWVNMGDSYASGKPRTQEDCEGGGQRWANRQSELRAPGLKSKDLIGVPWMLAFALRADGWYLRQEIIWNKPNPMPESVTDRCTKAHESLFLLAKSPVYYCDMDAIKEPAVGINNYAVQGGPVPGAPAQSRMRPSVPKGGFGGKTVDAEQPAFRAVTEDRNRRSIWTIATKPYSGAHFAVYPEELIEPCILAGAPSGGVVLDPFFGSGTTGAVAQRLGRNWIGCELNPAYGPLQTERLRQPGLVF